MTTTDEKAWENRCITACWGMGFKHSIHQLHCVRWYPHQLLFKLTSYTSPTLIRFSIFLSQSEVEAQLKATILCNMSNIVRSRIHENIFDGCNSCWSGDNVWCQRTLFLKAPFHTCTNKCQGKKTGTHSDKNEDHVCIIWLKLLYSVRDKVWKI